MALKTLQDQVNSLTWFHSIDFGNGVVAPGLKSPQTLADEAQRFFGAISLDGKTFLDIGAWNGFFSFEAKRRGAARVLATDKFIWTNDPNGRAGFDLARKHLGLEIEAEEIDVPELSQERIGTFDAVLFAGVFYHLFDAPALLKQVTHVASKLLIVETHQDLLSEPRPAMVYYPGGTLNNDPTNFWGPNPPLIRELLNEFRFSEIYYRSNGNSHGRGIYLAFRDTAAVSAFKFDSSDTAWLNVQHVANLVSPAKRTFGNLINFLRKRPMT